MLRYRDGILVFFLQFRTAFSLLINKKKRLFKIGSQRGLYIECVNYSTIYYIFKYSLRMLLNIGFNTRTYWNVRI
jgi:hypothetical protein